MKFCSLIVFFIFPSLLFSQDTTSVASSGKKEVEIINADKLQFNTLDDGTSIRKLVGNVQLKQEETLMFCDSAFMYKEENKINAFGNVHIKENDSIDIYSDTLLYSGNEKKAILTGNANLNDGQTNLVSKTIYYDSNLKIGSYRTRGIITTDSTILESNKGLYFTKTKDAHFSDSVIITDPDYNLISDTLHYNTKTKIAKFYGPTTIYNDSSTITCFNGTYRTEEEIATFGKGTIIYNGPQTLMSDSLYYNRAQGYGKAMKYFDWQDIDIEAGMVGTLAEYFENEQKILAYERPLLKVKMEGDTLFMRGENIFSRENKDNNDKKEFWAFKKVRMFKSDLQGIGDSLYYSFADTLLRMYQEPIVWNEQSEMRGDTIYAQLANDKVETIDFRENAFIASQSSGKLFDQIKGKYVTGYFLDDALDRMFCNKNAESFYFGKNDDGSYVGGNLVKAAKMWIYLKDDEINKITFITDPVAVFTPMTDLLESNQIYLPNFKWNGVWRPKDKNDL